MAGPNANQGNKVGTKSDWKVQMIVFTGGTMGSVKIERFEHNLKALDVKKKEWTQRDPYPETACQSTIGGPRCSSASILCMLVKPRKHIIDTMLHRMSICRRNSRRAQDTIIRETNGNR